VLSLYPIMFRNLSAALAGVDPSLREAAQNLGASGFRLFRTITLPLILPGWFAGAIIVFIWAFTDLGTPLIFGYSRVVPVQIFDSITELNTNPMGYALVVFVLVLTVVLFLVSKRFLAGRRHEMLTRGHAGTGEVDARPLQTALIWGALGGVIFLALLQYLRFPTGYRSESRIVAMGLMVLGIGLEVYAAIAANRLFDMVAQAKRASSFWGVPSLSEMESLQSGLTWAGRGGVVLGIGAGLALLSSLRVTAQALGASEQLARANRALALLVTAGVGVVVMGVLVELVKSDAGPIILLFGVAMLFLAVVLLVDWLKLLFGLATELERGPEPPSESAPAGD